MAINHNKNLETALRTLNPDQLEAFVDFLDVSSSTYGYDNDDSTGFEIFGNGFDLAERATGRDVQYGEVEGSSGFITAYFVIGTEGEALARVSQVLEENPSEPT